MKFYNLLGYAFPDPKETANNIIKENMGAPVYLPDDELVDEEPKDMDASILTTLTMNVLKNGDTAIYFQWVDNSEEIAEVTAQTLHRLCTGQYKRTFEEILAKLANDNTRLEPFVGNIEKYWKKQNSNEPIIKPRDALRANHQQ